MAGRVTSGVFLPKILHPEFSLSFQRRAHPAPSDMSLLRTKARCGVLGNLQVNAFLDYVIFIPKFLNRCLRSKHVYKDKEFILMWKITQKDEIRLGSQSTLRINLQAVHC